MNYQLKRYEENQNEIFISVYTIFEDNSEWEQGYWLSESEKEAILENDYILNEIVTQTALRGEAAFIQYKEELVEFN